MRVEEVRNNHKFYTLSKFKGVDYSSSPMQVKNYRATDMANFMLKDGVLSKRNGFMQVKLLNGFGSVRGIWKTPDGKYLYIVGTAEYVQIYLAETLPKFTLGDITKDEAVVDVTDTLLMSIGDLNPYKQHVSAITSNDKLYIFCGKYLVYGELNNADGTKSWQLKEVANDRYNTYIPTTMIDIVRWDSKLNYPNPRVLNEKTNLLIRMRKNTLLGEQKDASLPDTADARYYLDGDLLYGQNEFPPKITIYDGDSINIIKDFELQSDLETWVSSKTGIEVGRDSHPEKLDVVAIVYVPYSTTANAFFKNGTKIVVEYPVAENANNANYITTATVAELYGADGRADRVFVAGNDMAPNAVYFSENQANYTPDFTYFPINNFVMCGQTQKEISALGRTAGGSLAVYKNVGSLQEPSVYFITGSAYSLGADEAGVPLYEDKFNVASGNIQVEGISPRAVTNFAGDSLFVGKGGVYAIELSSNVASTEKFARERSRTINQRLNKLGPQNAKAIVHDDKYYLAVGNEVFVADARYKYTLDADMDNTFNYEWYRLTDLGGIHCWFIEDDELYFVIGDGPDIWLCKFTDSYADIYRTQKTETAVYKASNGEQRIAVYTEPIGDGQITSLAALRAKQAVKVSAYLDGKEMSWDVNTLKEDSVAQCAYFSVPSDITLPEGGISLKMYLPINAYWKSAILDLSDPIYRKNLHSISGVFLPKTNGRMEIGYATKMNETAVTAQGVNSFDFGNIDFNFFSFDGGGLANAFRKKCFERGFVCIQLLFKSNSIGDCAIDSITLEYNTTIKNIGVR